MLGPERPERGKGSKLADFLDSPGGLAYQQANNPLRNIEGSDAAAHEYDKAGHDLGASVGKSRNLTGGELALADLARNATVFGPQAPHLSATNPFLDRVRAPMSEAGFGHSPGFAGSGAQSGQLADAMKDALSYENVMHSMGGPGAPDPFAVNPQSTGSSSGGAAGSNFGFARVRRR